MSFTVVLGILTRPFGANYSKADIPLILIFTHVFAMSATNPNANDNKNKVNRCLARYSPRATTTNRPTNRALNKPAWPGPN